jgi:hypothetical protein
LSKITPLKIRRVRPARQGLAGGGVIEITPFIPLSLRGRFKERALTLRENGDTNIWYNGRREGMKIAVKRLIRDEKGRAMVMALILLAVGGLTTTPLLAYMSTGLIAGEFYERSTAEVYAADAGVEDGVWKIQHNADGVPQGFCDPSLAYNISDVNGKSVDVTIEWVNNLTTSVTYKITSIATTDSNSSTTVESYVEKIIGGELDIFSGILASKGDIWLKQDSTVTGDIYIGGDITGEFTHDGEIIPTEPDSFPTQEQDEEFAQMFKEEAMAGGTHYGSLNISSDRDLGPLYITGNLDITTKDITVNLMGTIYVEGEIRATKEYTITGSGSMVAVGNIYLSKLAGYGTEGDSVIMSLNGNITFKKEAVIEALIYAPNGTISFDKGATVTGSVVGADIQADKEGTFTYIQKAGGFDLPGQLPDTVEIKTYSITHDSA